MNNKIKLVDVMYTTLFLNNSMFYTYTIISLFTVYEKKALRTGITFRCKEIMKTI